jgi:hypothetical protein
MKPTLLSLLGISVVAVGLTAFAQNTSQPNPQVQAPGPGSAPHAWCDRNGDGICDFTGMPVGQGRGQMMSPGMGRGMGAGMGRGMRAGMGRGMAAGMGRGMACPYSQGAQSMAPSAQPAPAPAK